MMDALIDLIPPEVLHRSGKVFYSGRAAFVAPKQIYLLGLNPGGDPRLQLQTVEDHTRRVQKRFPDNWSAYRDESWNGFKPGTRGLAPRVLHLLSGLGFDPGSVPCSNLIFVRTRREIDLAGKFTALAESCWAFHDRVIGSLKPRMVICFGARTGRFLRKKLGADILVDEAVESNRRGWRASVFETGAGLKVAVLPHPSIANWISEHSDPTAMLRRTLS